MNRIVSLLTVAVSASAYGDGRATRTYSVLRDKRPTGYAPSGTTC